MAEYYAQRADAGLIISEATSVTPMGVGYPNTPGIWSTEQVQGWKKVTDAVHAKGGKIIPALACRSHLRPDLPRWPAAGRAQRHQARRARQPGPPGERL